MIKKFALVISILVLFGCQTPSKPSLVGVYSNGKIFNLRVDTSDKVVVGDLFLIKRSDDSRVGFHYEYFDEMTKGFDSRLFFESLFGDEAPPDQSILNSRKIIFGNLVEHKNVSSSGNVAYYFRYEDGLEKVVVFEDTKPNRYLVIESTGGDAMELFNSMRDS